MGIVLVCMIIGYCAYIICVGDHSKQVEVLDSSVLSTKSLRDERFPKPELEISFTPLKPDRINVRKPGEEESVMIKLRRTARKRKSPEMQVYR